MGAKESKEEVIIAQAGNSGGATNDVSQKQPLTAIETTGIVSTCLLVALIIYLTYRYLLRAFEKKIHKELSKSKDELGKLRSEEV